MGGLFDKKVKYVFLFVLGLFVGDTAFSATKKKKEEIPPEPIKKEIPKTDTVQLPVKKRTYFYKIDNSIMSLMENGSPESIKRAMSMLRKNDGEYEENEKVLIAIATEIMKSVWTSEKINWTNIPVNSENPYIGAINSVNNGVLDISTGNVDFFSTVLPTLILLKPSVTESMYASCEQSLKKALEHNGASILVFYLYGVLLEKQNRYDEAAEYYKRTFERSAENLEITLSYSRLLRKMNELESALKVLSNYSSSTPNIELLKEKSYVYFTLKDYASAEECVAKVLQQTPNDLDFVLFRAKIFAEQKDYIHALSYLDMYSRQNSTSLDYLLLRTRIQLDWSKNTTAASETIEKAINLYPDNEEVLLLAARIASMTSSAVGGQFADDLVEKVLNKNPENKEARTYALMDLVQRENWHDAYKVSSELMKSNPNEDVIAKHIEICLKVGKKTEAFEIAKKAYEANPNSEELLQTYILAYSQTGSKTEVLAYIESLIPTASPKLKSYLFYRKSFLELTDDNVLQDLRLSLTYNSRNSETLYRLYEIYEKKDDQKKALYYLRQVHAINPNNSIIKQQVETLTKLIN